MKYLLAPITFPLSLLYGVITFIRNKFFDWGWYKELEFEVPVISVGNLAVGGSGKTPHIAYLIELLSNKHVAVLSRGYGRRTKGFLLVNENTSTRDAGDEIKMLKNRYPHVPMAVHENRPLGIAELMAEHPDIEVILLDDAFQHRHVKPKVNILLTEFRKPFFRDFVMPFGRLREWRSGYKRADLVVFTKSPTKESGLESESESELESESVSVSVKLSKPCYYSSIRYDELRHEHGPDKGLENILLVTSIANPSYLSDYIQKQYPQAKMSAHRLGDHHTFTDSDIQKLAAFEGTIICTEKDWVKIKELSLPENMDLRVQPISVVFANTHFDHKLMELFNDQ